ncbi:MAG: riboflavin biosynthesis pyrimidine reductase [Candidatus Poriferisodalaceae bacterium]|jgi:riboflavin biosynthesis pyrimidine reductase|tara:strand:- start:8712 stop:9461 length:750 start_codon:yes stop_codon:yes gene_type:complete
MHRIFPPPLSDLDLDLAYTAPRNSVAGRPWLMLNMIASLDGGTSIDGVSGPLGGPSDKDVFGCIRTFPDIILVGSATAVAESYNSPSASVSSRASRLTNGAWPTARIALVSASLSFPLDLPMFMRPDQRPLVITTTSADPDRLAKVGEKADIIQAGTDLVDFVQALEKLSELGARVILSEGGSSINGQLIEANLVNEILLTVAPIAIAGNSQRIATGIANTDPTDFDLEQVLTDGHYLFLRYLLSASAA